MPQGVMTNYHVCILLLLLLLLLAANDHATTMMCQSASIGVETQMTTMSPTSPRADATGANDELSCMYINYNFFVTLSMTQQ